jgi:hypothetical protein
LCFVQLCIALNNIELVRSNLLKLETNAGFQTAIRTVAERHSRPEFITTTQNALRVLIGDTDSQILAQLDCLERSVNRIVQRGVELHSAPIFLDSQPQRTQMDQFVQYLKANYLITAKWLKGRLRTRVLLQIWESSFSVFVDNVQFGVSAHYTLLVPSQSHYTLTLTVFAFL